MSKNNKKTLGLIALLFLCIVAAVTVYFFRESIFEKRSNASASGDQHSAVEPKKNKLLSTQNHRMKIFSAIQEGKLSDAKRIFKEKVNDKLNEYEKRELLKKILVQVIISAHDPKEMDDWIHEYYAPIIEVIEEGKYFSYCIQKGKWNFIDYFIQRELYSAGKDGMIKIVPAHITEKKTGNTILHLLIQEVDQEALKRCRAIMDKQSHWVMDNDTASLLKLKNKAGQTPVDLVASDEIKQAFFPEGGDLKAFEPSEETLNKALEHNKQRLKLKGLEAQLHRSIKDGVPLDQVVKAFNHWVDQYSEAKEKASDWSPQEDRVVQDKAKKVLFEATKQYDAIPELSGLIAQYVTKETIKALCYEGFFTQLVKDAKWGVIECFLDENISSAWLEEGDQEGNTLGHLLARAHENSEAMLLLDQLIARSIPGVLEKRNNKHLAIGDLLPKPKLSLDKKQDNKVKDVEMNPNPTELIEQKPKEGVVPSGKEESDHKKQGSHAKKPIEQPQNASLNSAKKFNTGTPNKRKNNNGKNPSLGIHFVSSDDIDNVEDLIYIIKDSKAHGKEIAVTEYFADPRKNRVKDFKQLVEEAGEDTDVKAFLKKLIDKDYDEHQTAVDHFTKRVFVDSKHNYLEIFLRYAPYALIRNALIFGKIVKENPSLSNLNDGSPPLSERLIGNSPLARKVTKILLNWKLLRDPGFFKPYYDLLDETTFLEKRKNIQHI